MVGSYQACRARTVITLGFILAIGLLLAVPILSVTLPEHRNKP